MRDRGVSHTLSYALTLGISTLLVVGLLTAGGSFVESQRNGVVDSELEVVGERLAADIATADRLVRMSDGSAHASVRSRLPASVADLSYTVEIVAADGNVSVELTTPTLDRTVRTNVANTTAIAPGAVAGGDVRIAYNRTAGRLEVRDA